MKYSVCANSVYGRLPLEEAIARIAALGFSAYEFWGPIGIDIDAVARATREAGLTAVGFCAPMVPLNVPERRDEYAQALRQTLEIAKKLDCRLLIAQVGQERPDCERAAQHACIVEGLRACAPMLADANITLAVEPLNALVDHKGYYLTHAQEGFEIIREVESPNVKLLFDVYHQQISEGNLIENLTSHIGDVAHIHIAGNPGRHEPHVNSEVHYPTVLRAAEEAGYAGFIGLEYFPIGDPDASLRAILEQMPL